MRYCLAGAGNIAWFLGTGFQKAGHVCTGIYNRNRESGLALAEKLDTSFASIEEIKNCNADLCFIAVSDTAIAAVAALFNRQDTVLVHTAGAVAINVLSPALRDCAVLWPVYSIVKNNLPTHRNIPCAFEASSQKAKDTLLEIGRSITDNLFEAGFDQRKWLHLTAVISNNFTTHLLAICEQICADQQLPFSVLLPIIEQTFERVSKTSPRQLQTGPAIRRDFPTIREHMALLQNPFWQEIYKAITASIQAQD